MGAVLSSRDIEDIFGCHIWDCGATSVYRLKARDAAKTSYDAQDCLHNKELSEICSSEVEKL